MTNDYGDNHDYDDNYDAPTSPPRGKAGRRRSTTPQPKSGPASEKVEKEPEPDVFADVGEFVEHWLAPVLAGKLLGGGRGRTWCRQWWRHREVSVRLHALWRGWEGARRSEEPLAMSSWWVQHTDPHLRALCDGEAGPMWRCTPEAHVDIPAYPTIPVPAGWFDADHNDEQPPADGGRGPDFRTITARTAGDAA
ncbi:DUF4913 domain-containing protein [Antrihabitans sp. YC3-6]|uniref:DUF4913 domain-containing protein n=1 Tax=Antrihabitans stalagmiti TaxID=2799499 RepID=A0A934NWI5_9NOCA|nr:DUF4913 domain-containing protein [Antrihabitans stalagmiti]MBJ8342894.1 DUF4913 domain-containing protein [Antrihabitans stalagmiti]